MRVPLSQYSLRFDFATLKLISVPASFGKECGLAMSHIAPFSHWHIWNRTW